MIKAIGGLFRTLLLLALLGLVGYNTMELRRLQTEVTLLREQRRGTKRPAATVESAGAFVPDWVGEAQTHVERARVFLRSKRYDEARKETQTALLLVQKKAETARNESAEAITRGRAVQETVTAEATSLWNQINRLTRLPNDTNAKANAKPQK